jgi:hypothetical protein
MLRKESSQLFCLRKRKKGQKEKGERKGREGTERRNGNGNGTGEWEKDRGKGEGRREKCKQINNAEIFIVFRVFKILFHM